MYKHLYINMFHCTYLELVVILDICFINLANLHKWEHIDRMGGNAIR